MNCKLASTGLVGSGLIYLDSDYNTIIPRSNEILLPVNGSTYLKVDSSGLQVYIFTGDLIRWCI